MRIVSRYEVYTGIRYKTQWLSSVWVYSIFSVTNTERATWYWFGATIAWGSFQAGHWRERDAALLRRWCVTMIRWCHIMDEIRINRVRVWRLMMMMSVGRECLIILLNKLKLEASSIVFYSIYKLIYILWWSKRSKLICWFVGYDRSQ